MGSSGLLDDFVTPLAISFLPLASNHCKLPDLPIAKIQLKRLKNDPRASTNLTQHLQSNCCNAFEANDSRRPIPCKKSCFLF